MTAAPKLIKWQQKACDVILGDIAKLQNKESASIGTIMVGPPGTGKTFCITEIVNNIRKQYPHLKVHLTATTGAAASRMSDGKTLASWLRVGSDAMKLDKYEHILSAARASSPQTIRETDVLIIDEVSMMSQTQFENLNKLCQDIRENPVDFGGMYIILIGDPMQLPPIPHDAGPGLHRNTTEFVPSLLERQYPGFNYIVADEMMRSKGDVELQRVLLKLISPDKIIRSEAVVTLRNMCYNGEMNMEGVIEFQKQMGPIILTTVKEGPYSVSGYNNAYRDNEDIQEIEILGAEKMHSDEDENLIKLLGGYKGLQREEDEIEKRDCWSKDNKVRTNVPFMIRMNHKTPEGTQVYNGQLGNVLSYSSEKQEIKFQLLSTKEVVTIKRIEFKSEWYPQLGFVAYPLIEATAMTIHKAQGATIKSGIVFENRRSWTDPYCAHMLYTVFSRVERIQDIRIPSFIVSDILDHPLIDKKLAMIWKLPYMASYLRPHMI